MDTKYLMNKEGKRKLVHILAGVSLMLLVWYIDAVYARLILIAVLVLGVVLSVIEKRQRIPIVSGFLDALERKKERKRFPGRALIMLIGGTLLAELFFNDILIVSGLIVVTFGDSVAHLVGKKLNWLAIPWDKTKHAEGRVAGILASWALMLILWDAFLAAAYLKLLIAATVGLLVETIPFRKIGLDDNLFIPFVVALTLYLQF